MRVGPCVAVAVSLLGAPAAAFVQAQTPAAATLVVAEGVVRVDEKPVDVAAAPLVLPDAAVVRTMEGRAVVALKRGGWLFLDRNASARVLANGVYNFNRIEMLTGSAIVASGTSSPLVACENEIRLSNSGMFRFDVQSKTATRDRTCEFHVFDGAAAVPLVSVTDALRPGQAMTLDHLCGDMLPTSEFPRDVLDEFDQWARRMAR